MAGWYALPSSRNTTVEIILRGENAQVWHRGAEVLFRLQSGQHP